MLEIIAGKARRKIDLCIAGGLYHTDNRLTNAISLTISQLYAKVAPFYYIGDYFNTKYINAQLQSFAHIWIK